MPSFWGIQGGWVGHFGLGSVCPRSWGPNFVKSIGHAIACWDGVACPSFFLPTGYVYMYIFFVLQKHMKLMKLLTASLVNPAFINIFVYLLRIKRSNKGESLIWGRCHFHHDSNIVYIICF